LICESWGLLGSAGEEENKRPCDQAI